MSALVEVRPRHDDAELVFQAEGRLASVLVAVYGSRLVFEFPHVANDHGLSLGSDEADAALLAEARRTVVLLDGSVVWRSFRGRL